VASQRDGWIGWWSPGIGDPTIGGWLTVGAYLTGAALCLWAAWKARREGDASVEGRSVAMAFWRADAPLHRRLSALWTFLALILLFLGINKQLDLQSAVTEMGRMIAWNEGWYDDRRTVQAWFVAVVTAVGLVMLYGLLRLTRGALSRVRIAVLGMGCLLCFVVVRAASFHYVDKLLGLRLGGLRINWILEGGGIALIALEAHRFGKVRT
jgi:hypothetical protein